MIHTIHNENGSSWAVSRLPRRGNNKRWPSGRCIPELQMGSQVALVAATPREGLEIQSRRKKPRLPHMTGRYFFFSASGAG